MAKENCTLYRDKFITDCNENCYDAVIGYMTNMLNQNVTEKYNRIVLKNLEK